MRISKNCVLVVAVPFGLLSHVRASGSGEVTGCVFSFNLARLRASLIDGDEYNRLVESARADIPGLPDDGDFLGQYFSRFAAPNPVWNAACTKPADLSDDGCPRDGTPFKPVYRTTESPTCDLVHQKFFFKDCYLFKNAEQIFKDAGRVPIKGDLLEFILGLPEEVLEERFKSDDRNFSKFMTDTAERLASELLTMPPVTIDETKRNTFIKTLAEIIDSCTEVSLLYSSYGRAPRDFREGEILFNFYQGMQTTCYYLVFFELTSTMVMPKKLQIYNMVATIVEDVNQLPLSLRESRNDYYKQVLSRLISELDRKFPVVAAPVGKEKIDSVPQAISLKSFLSQEVNPDKEISLVQLPASLESFITTTGAIGRSDGFSDNTVYLPKIWSFVSTYGHTGLIALFSACYVEFKAAANRSPRKDELEPLVPFYLANAVQGLSVYNVDVNIILQTADCIVRFWNKCPDAEPSSPRTQEAAKGKPRFAIIRSVLAKLTTKKETKIGSCVVIPDPIKIDKSPFHMFLAKIESDAGSSQLARTEESSSIAASVGNASPHDPSSDTASGGP